MSYCASSNFIKRPTVASSGGSTLNSVLSTKQCSQSTHPLSFATGSVSLKRCAHETAYKATALILSTVSRQIRVRKQSNCIAWSFSSPHCQPLGLPVVSTGHWSGLEWDQRGEGGRATTKSQSDKERLAVLLTTYPPASPSVVM